MLSRPARCPPGAPLDLSCARPHPEDPAHGDPARPRSCQHGSCVPKVVVPDQNPTTGRILNMRRSHRDVRRNVTRDTVNSETLKPPTPATGEGRAGRVHAAARKTTPGGGHEAPACEKHRKSPQRSRASDCLLSDRPETRVATLPGRRPGGRGCRHPLPRQSPQRSPEADSPAWPWC